MSKENGGYLYLLGLEDLEDDVDGDGLHTLDAALVQVLRKKKEFRTHVPRKNGGSLPPKRA